MTTMPGCPYTSGGRSLASSLTQHSATLSPHTTSITAAGKEVTAFLSTPIPHPQRSTSNMGKSPTDVMPRSSAGLGQQDLNLRSFVPQERARPDFSLNLRRDALSTVLLVPDCRPRCRHRRLQVTGVGRPIPPISTPPTGCTPGSKTASAPERLRPWQVALPLAGHQLRMAGRRTDRRHLAGLA